MKPTTQFIILCREAFTAAGTNNLSLINIFTQVSAESFPFVFSRFALVVNFDSEADGTHVLKTVVTAPDASIVANTDLSVTVRKGNMQVIANFEQMRFTMAGTYTFSLTLDGDALGSRELAVRPVITGSAKPVVA